MLMSMTGFGKREFENADILLSIEIKSINSRYLEVNHKIPRLFSDDEDNIINVVRKRLTRGKIIININYHILNEKLNQITLDKNKMNEYLKITNKLSKNNNIEGKLTIDKLLSFPDIINTTPATGNISYKRLLIKCLNRSIDDLLSMRATEGKNLSKDIKSRLSKIKKDLKLISKISNKSQKEVLRTYKSKIKSFINNNQKLIFPH